MAASPHTPNASFRQLRGAHSPAEFAALVRRAAREIGETVSCDARYIGRVESGEIRCPNYAYERVFLHMFPGRTLADLGFSPREAVRGRAATLTFSLLGDQRRIPARAGENEAAAVEDAVRRIRLLDDRHGADALYRTAAEPLRAAYALLDAGATRQSTEDRLHAGAGELALSVGWLAHDSGRFGDARSHYAEALATARVSGDAGLEAHAFCNTAFLARDCDRPREAVRAAQAGQRAAKGLGSARLLSLLCLREAGGWAGLADRSSCEEALGRAHRHFARGASAADPEWMTFFGEAELESLEAGCWALLGAHGKAARHARRAADLQEAHFARNVALYTAELAGHLARAGAPEEAAGAGGRVLDLLAEVQSTRVRSMLADTARTLVPHQRSPRVSTFLDRHATV
ncbi:tetratricopeptide repeat protein [Streptomyces sp. WAC06614]|uniref:tetratricopeptide repeat protein n=1 Tax=Streptomyces sp. WAC06614 TaxID=2487416 RepID=UPI000F775910|nr:tetratricopeptide repeat protein [Streptomyces sp. WAC06614]RSS79663.1 tetratricopeptide repeat protein [Streptomyces sp. WAC06614]